MNQTPADIQRLLPLTPVAFEILLAVAEEDRHGYAILRDIQRSTDGSMRVNPGTLYRAIARLVDSGLLVESAEREAPGLRVARGEARRLEAQAVAARSKLFQKA